MLKIRVCIFIRVVLCRCLAGNAPLLPGAEISTSYYAQEKYVLYQPDGMLRRKSLHYTKTYAQEKYVLNTAANFVLEETAFHGRLRKREDENVQMWTIPGQSRSIWPPIGPPPCHGQG
jgi:hypothetical protein